MLHDIKIKVFYKNVLKQDLFSIFFREFSQKLPSVSKIIQATMPPEQRAILDRWEANKIAELGKLTFLKFSFSGMATKMCAIVLRVLKFTL